MSGVVITLVRLRWALTWAAMRKSAWQAVGYALGLVAGLFALLIAVAGAVMVGIGPAGRPHGVQTVATTYFAVMHIAVVMAGSFAVLMVAGIQLMFVGDGSAMSPKRFELYGIPDRTLQAGLFVSGLAGTPAIVGTLVLMAWAFAYRWVSIGMVMAGLVAAPMAIVTMMSLSKMIIMLATTLVNSNRGKSMFYIVTMLLFIVMCQLPNLLMNGAGAAGRNPSIKLFGIVADVLAWTPLGAAFQLPFDVAVGAWLPLIARCIELVAVWVVCFVVGAWCLKHQRMTLGAGSESVRIKGIGEFGWMPDSPSGAISARLVSYLKRDPRQSVMLIMPLLMVVIFALQSQGIAMRVWQVLIWVGVFFSITESNGLAYDGQGFTMQVIAGTPGLADRLGRIRVYAVFVTAYLLVLAFGIFVFTGDWRSMDGIWTGLTCTGVGLGLAWCSLGLAEVVSCVLIYPVPSLEKPFSSPQGRAAAQGFFPFVQMFGSFLLMLPTGIVAIALAVTGVFHSWLWVLIPVALANGATALAVGSWLGGKLMDARSARIVQTLDSFVSLQR